MNSSRHFVSEIARVVREAGDLSPGGEATALTPFSNAPKALIFSPHPDDESITGGFALRLLRESRWNVINVAVTLGSKRERRAERLKELTEACGFLGFNLLQTGPEGLEKVNAATRAADAAHWARSVAVVAEILRTHRPKAVFLPHENDLNSTHIGTHLLVMDALKEAGDLSCCLVETEYWGQMTSPNLLVEHGVNNVADLVAATALHVGEVKRNPFHLTLPAWMQDNVRRGAELVGGQGTAAPGFLFGQLFRMRRWESGKIKPCFTGGRHLPASAEAGSLF